MATINDALANAQLDSFGARFANGFLRFYGDTAPADANAALTGATLIAEINLDATPFDAAAGRSLTKAGADTYSDDQINQDGTVNTFRLVSADGTHVLQGTVTATGGGGEITLQDVNLVQNGTLTITGFSITQ